MAPFTMTKCCSSRRNQICVELPASPRFLKLIFPFALIPRACSLQPCSRGIAPSHRGSPKESWQTVFHWRSNFKRLAAEAGRGCLFEQWRQAVNSGIHGTVSSGPRPRRHGKKRFCSRAGLNQMEQRGSREKLTQEKCRSPKGEARFEPGKFP